VFPVPARRAADELIYTSVTDVAVARFDQAALVREDYDLGAVTQADLVRMLDSWLLAPTPRTRSV
jgi:hypothetical protein